MKLSEYTSLEEKSKHFKECVEINTFLELKNLIDELRKNKNTFLYRGVKEAKYKLYCSAQREWITENLKENFNVPYDEYISSLLVKLYKITKKYKQRQFPMWQNDWNCLTFLQHYGAPSPFLDFTTNINVALYFCIYNAQNNNSNEIEGYLSLYFFNPNCSNVIAMSSILTKLKKLLKSQSKKEDSELTKCHNVADLISFDYIVTDEGKDKVFWIDVKRISPLVWGNKYLDFNLFVDNPNMASQKGELVSMNNEEKCLEELLVKQITCININKSLIPHIERYLKLNNIDHDTLFPNMNDIAKRCVDETYNDLTRKAIM